MIYLFTTYFLNFPLSVIPLFANFIEFRISNENKYTMKILSNIVDKSINIQIQSSINYQKKYIRGPSILKCIVDLIVKNIFLCFYTLIIYNIFKRKEKKKKNAFTFLLAMYLYIKTT